MMEHLSEPRGIKDHLSRHLYMNRAAYLYTNTPLNFDVAGKYDHEFPADWADSAADFIEHDKMTSSARPGHGHRNALLVRQRQPDAVYQRKAAGVQR